MEIAFGSRLKHAGTLFWVTKPLGSDTAWPKLLLPSGPAHFSAGGNERSIITSVYNRIALDASSIAIQHARLDEDGRFTE